MPPGETLHAHEPRVIGPYRLLRRLGAGGMGTVYLAESTGRRVAVKIVRPDLAADDEFRRRFRQEVDAARRVAPFCTAEVLDADPDAPAPYLVTEFIDGVRLDHAVENGPIGRSTLTGLAVGVATALTAIHGAGLVHRDLKPSNVLLSISGPRVIDFGIAQALEGAKAKPTAWGFGSAGWMAPEQVNGQPIGPEADVFTWGILVAYAGTGRHPFGTGTDLELSTRIVSAEPVLNDLPSDLKALVSAALAKNPDARPSARDLLLSLISLPPARSADGAGRPSPTAVGQAEELLSLTSSSTLPGVSPTRIGPPTSSDESAAPAHGAARIAREPSAVPPDQDAPAPQRESLLRGAPPAYGVPHLRVPPPAYGDALPPAEQLRWPAAGVVVPPPAGAPPASGALGAGRHSPPVPGPAAPGPYDPGQPGQPPESPARSGRRRLLLVAGIALTIALATWLISAVAGGDGDDPQTGPAGGRTAPSSPAPAPDTAELGSPARDDQVEFVAEKIDCNVRQLGSGIFPYHPSGRFCVVTMEITNSGPAERTLSADDQYLLDSAGERSAAAGDWLVRVWTDGDVWTTIQPGATVRGEFVFDVALDAEPRELELHERPESDGVTIRLPDAGGLPAPPPSD